jgi:hypothetical protein
VPSRPPPWQLTVPTRTPKGCGVLGATSSKAGHSRCSTLEHRPPLVRQGQRAWTPTRPHDRTTTCQMLLRKEVIQPHLPVRLPCYDLVPIASPTFDSSLSYELGHWLRVLPTFVT